MQAAASKCYGNQGQGTMIAAANPSLYNNGAACGTSACGRRYRVKCTGGTNNGVPHPCTGSEETVTIVDLCPGCGNNQLDLSQQVFSTIANPDAGRIRIDYTRDLRCALQDKTQLHFLPSEQAFHVQEEEKVDVEVIEISSPTKTIMKARKDQVLFQAKKEEKVEVEEEAKTEIVMYHPLA
ncbi:Expansin-like EG45 domain-containing protein [Forsythia ovata]|uniref:Expansin-like EG45 domain-containing protein n=1 Tax=Forsythia ovata TaxID=205694 RepID=A0ABD1SQC5_9LAMI